MEKIRIQQISSKDNPRFHSEVLHLRNNLLRLPIGLDLFQEDLGQEVNHITFAAIAKSNDCETTGIEGEVEKVVGCILVAPLEGDETSVKFRQMAILPEFQGQGLGARLVGAAEDHVIQEGKKRICLHARKHAVGFYMKSGFHTVSNEEFLELGIPHFELEKKLV